MHITGIGKKTDVNSAFSGNNNFSLRIIQRSTVENRLPLSRNEGGIETIFFYDFISGFLAGPKRPERCIRLFRVFYKFDFNICEDFF